MRLTKEIKENIRDITLERALAEKEAVHAKHVNKFVTEAFWAQITKEQYQCWKTAVPGLIQTSYARSINVDCRVLGMLQTSLPKATEYPYHPMSTYITYDDLSAERKLKFKELIKEKDELEALRVSIITNLNAVLSSVTTVKKLREVWVNGAEVIDKALGMVQQSPTVYAPSIAIQTLDSIVPLP